MKKFVIYSIALVSAIAVGAGAGIIIKRVILPPDQNIIGFNPDALKVDKAALFKKFNASKNPTSDLKPYELVLYAQEKYKEAENSVSYCYGLANAVAVGLNVAQDVRSAQVKVGNSFFEEQVSKSSQVAVSKRMYLENGSTNTKLYKEKDGKCVNITDTHTSSEYVLQKDCTPSEYKQLYGRELPDMFIYLIHSSTVLEEKIEEADDGYQVSLKLDEKKGGYNYAFQMISVSELEATPVFKSIYLFYKLSKNFELISLDCDEEFSARKMGFDASTHNNLKYKYYQGKEYKIPSIDEDFDYQTLREVN